MIGDWLGLSRGRVDCKNWCVSWRGTRIPRSPAREHDGERRLTTVIAHRSRGSEAPRGAAGAGSRAMPGADGSEVSARRLVANEPQPGAATRRVSRPILFRSNSTLTRPRRYSADEEGLIPKPISGLMRFVLPIIVLAVCAVTAPARAQVGPSLEVTRIQLDSLLTSYEEVAQSSAYSGTIRERARTDAALIRRRLEAGDFQIGDQVTLSVEGEPTLTAVFTVEAGPVLQLPTIGTVSLVGVLRSELQEHLRQELSRYLRDPVLTARSSIRVLVSGQILSAGYKVVPTTMVFSEILTASGGATGAADIPRIRIERGDQVIWDPESLQRAIVEGRTLDQMSVQAGDHVVVPTLREGAGSSIARWSTTIIIPVILLVLALMDQF